MPTREALREYYTNQIHLNGYVSVDFPINGSDIDPLFDNFRSLLDEIYEKPNDKSQDIVDAFWVKYPGRPDDSAGFIEQRRVGQLNPYEPVGTVATEDKDLLHFTPLTSGHTHEYMRTRGGLPKIARRLISQCSDLQEAVKQSVAPVFNALGIEDLMLAPNGKEYQNIHILRIIRYLGNQSLDDPTYPFISRDSLAELHFDRSKFTAALWESSSGLVGAPGNNGLGEKSLTVEEFDAIKDRALASPIRHHSGLAKLFAGSGYNRLSESAQDASGNIPLLLHGVVDDHPGEERCAVVFFMNEHAGRHDSSVPSEEERHYQSIRKYLEERQLRLGGMVVQGSMAETH